MDAVIIPEIQEELNDLAEEYARLFDAKVKEVLKRPKFFGKGSLRESVRTMVQQATPTTPPRINIEYAEHGEIIGKRKLLYTSLANIDGMLDFVKSSKFRVKSVPGYAKGVTPNISEADQRKRIAFAIAKSKYQKERNRPKRWKKLALPELLKEMNQALADTWADKVAQLIAESLTTN